MFQIIIVGSLSEFIHNHLKDGSDSDIDGVESCTEIQNIKQLLIWWLDISSPLNILQYIFDYELQIVFPNISVALRLLLTIPVTIASCENILAIYYGYNERLLDSLAILSI